MHPTVVTDGISRWKTTVWEVDSQGERKWWLQVALKDLKELRWSNEPRKLMKCVRQDASKWTLQKSKVLNSWKQWWVYMSFTPSLHSLKRKHRCPIPTFAVAMLDLECFSFLNFSRRSPPSLYAAPLCSRKAWGKFPGLRRNVWQRSCSNPGFRQHEIRGCL